MGTTNIDMYEPAAHYDHVHRAWQLIMGEEFHYGLFATPDTPLERATAALITRALAMITTTSLVKPENMRLAGTTPTLTPTSRATSATTS